MGQLQLRGDTLVTGGSDGSVRVWSLETMSAVHRLAAHDNSVTSLQFDDTRVVSGGSDGRVKIWDVKTGHPVRELITAESVWRVVFEDEKCVAVANRGNRVMMEVRLSRFSTAVAIDLTRVQVWSFSPPEDAYCERPVSLPQRLAEPTPNRPLAADLRRSALGIGGPSSAEETADSADDNNDDDDDVSMKDAGPSAPPRMPLTENTTFFHDDE